MTTAAPRTAYVDRIQFEDAGVTVRLSYPSGRVAVVAFDRVPIDDDQHVPADLSYPLAVSVQYDEAATVCSVLGASPGGPRRVPISLARALALAHSGVHTVFHTA